MWLFDEILPKTQSSNPQSGSTWGGSTPVQDDPIADQPIIISESEAIVTSNDILEQIDTKPQEVEKVAENTSILIEETPESIMDQIESTQTTQWTSTNQVSTVVESVNEVASPFFDLMSTTGESKPTDYSSNITDSNAVFQNTDEYIDHALEWVSTLMENLEKADQKKLAEEEEYKHQQEHFSELAIKAEEEHQKILAEKAHAEKVKSYLENEKHINHEVDEDITASENLGENEAKIQDSNPIEVDTLLNSPTPTVESIIETDQSVKNEEPSPIALV